MTEFLEDDESLCDTCIYKFSRTIIPKNIEDYDMPPEVNDIVLNDNEKIAITEALCLATDLDLSGCITIKCNKYEPMENQTGIILHPELL